MRKYLLSILLGFCSFNLLKAENSTSEESLLLKLSSVNSEWGKQSECRQVINATEFSINQTQTDWIATHLMLVEQVLRERNVCRLSDSQKQNRKKLLDDLHGYWHSRDFPVNSYKPYKTPVFIDRNGNHCAVGFLMKQSGAANLAQQINATQKFAYVHEIKVQGVKDWTDKNGFTLNELAWIQPGYPPATIVYDLDGGLNGTVNTIAPDANGQVVYVAGSFSQSVSGVNCNNVAAWTAGYAGWDWVPAGDGVNGSIYDLMLHDNKLYAGGSFTMTGTTAANHVAVYDISLGQWQSLGSLDNTVRTFAYYNGALYAGGDFTGFVAKWNGNGWQNITQNALYGEGVRTLEVWNNLLVIGGNFQFGSGVLRKNVVTYDGSQIGILDAGTITPVNDFEVHQGKLFAACDVVQGTDTCAIAVYENGTWHVRLKPSGDFANSFFGNSINSLLSYGSDLVAGGDFLCASGMTYSNNLMTISTMPVLTGDTTTLICNALAVTDTQVNTLAALGSMLYFGGEFISGVGDTTNHIGYLQLPLTGIDHYGDTDYAIHFYPNPASDFIRIESKNNEVILQTEVLDITGRTILAERNSFSARKLSVEQLSAGTYLLRALTNKGWWSSTLVKE